MEPSCPNTVHTSSFQGKLCSSRKKDLDGFDNRVDASLKGKEVQSWEEGSWWLETSVSQRTFQGRQRRAKNKVKKSDSFLSLSTPIAGKQSNSLF